MEIDGCYIDPSIHVNATRFSEETFRESFVIVDLEVKNFKDLL